MQVSLKSNSRLGTGILLVDSLTVFQTRCFGFRSFYSQTTSSKAAIALTLRRKFP